MLVHGAGVVYAVKPTDRRRSILAEVVGTNVSITELGFSRNSRRRRRNGVSLVGGMERGLRVPVTVVLSAGKPRCHVGAFRGNGVRLGSKSAFALAASSVMKGRREMSIGCRGLVGSLGINSHILITGKVVVLRIQRLGKGSTVYSIVTKNALSSEGDVGFPGGIVGRTCLDGRSGSSLLFNVGGRISCITTSFISAGRSMTSLEDFLSRGNKRSVRVVTGVRGHSNMSRIRRVYRVTGKVVVTEKSLNIRVPKIRMPTVRGCLVGGYHVLNAHMVATARVLRSVVRGPHPAETRLSSMTGTMCSNSSTVVLSKRSTTNGCPMRTMGGVTRATRCARGRVGCNGEFTGTSFRAGDVISTVSRTAYTVTVSISTGYVMIDSLANHAIHVIDHFHYPISVVNVAASRGT